MTGPGLLIKSTNVINDRLCSRLLDELVDRQLPCGGWAARAGSAQAALEPSCLAALVPELYADALRRVRDFLLHVQNPNGSWPAIVGDDPDGAWVTSLAMMALRHHEPAIPARLRGFRWLINCRGKESHWLWRWKFVTADRHVRFDPHKYGWPWFPETVSWIVPTSCAILALRQLPSACRSGDRVERAIDMLIDRACPGGGWNAGNGVVYAAPLAPHVDDTAVALLALGKENRNALFAASLEWLENRVHSLRAPWSLSWAILALAANARPCNSLEERLRAAPGLLTTPDTSTLALASMALDCRHALSGLGAEP